MQSVMRRCVRRGQGGQHVNKTDFRRYAPRIWHPVLRLKVIFLVLSGSQHANIIFTLARLLIAGDISWNNSNNKIARR